MALDRELLIIRLTVYELKDFCIGKLASVPTRNHRQIRSLRDEIRRHDPVSARIGAVAGFAEMSKECGSRFSRLLGAFTRARARAQYRGDEYREKHDQGSRQGAVRVYCDKSGVRCRLFMHAASMMQYVASWHTCLHLQYG